MEISENPRNLWISFCSSFVNFADFVVKQR